MVTKYYKDMLNKKLNKAAALISVTKRQTLYTNGQAMSETIKFESKNDKEYEQEDKNGKPYFNIEPKFSLNGDFDLSIQKKNFPDRTLIYMNDISKSYNSEKKHVFVNSIFKIQRKIQIW